ncbi:MAG TPA: hypothetical protein PK747_00575 [Acidobacteriota bacterium]|jgi:hypothetical protein|nr:hypothetical protein [Acidobacteriota bacterium]HNT16517.1 hypothetical protein [Acidobacteriota bacterium]HPA26029.1 hypothetical protein [Acidobacteriota bacterium]HQO18992.1 hypothetical protein [Acidobacteriota bacterium]HQQ45885.1 hypothetical protein [Acidobacteriota bacterium]
MDDQELFKVTCPHCRALLEIDPRNKLVVGGEAPPAPKEGLSFDERLKKLEEDKKNAQSKFEESVRAEKSKKEVLEKKFRELSEKAKDSKDMPMKRDIDLD